MTDHLSRDARSALMAKVRTRNTDPELVVRRALHALGYRFRLHCRDLPGTPDIVLRRLRVVVFMNGCFWHGHTCPRGKLPKSNLDYWTQKIAVNKARDQRVLRKLRRLGWRPMIIWECWTRSEKRLADKVLPMLLSLRAQPQGREKNGEGARQQQRGRRSADQTTRRVCPY